MKSVVRWLLLLAVVIGGGAFGLSKYKGQGRANAYAQELAQLKRDFLTASTGLSLLAPDAYRAEIGIHLTRYFDTLGKLARQYPELYDIERELKQGEEEMARGRMGQEHKLARDERILMTLDMFKKMGAGQYRPLYTAADKTFRFDVFEISAVEMAGNPSVRLGYAHWGAFGPVSYGNITGNIRAPQTTGERVQAQQFVGENQPPMLQVQPEKWVREFLPGVEIGYYTLPLFPQDAQAVQLTFNFSIKTVGGSTIPVEIAFPDIPVSDAWKLREGQHWQAQERIAAPEELRAAGAVPQPASR